MVKVVDFSGQELFQDGNFVVSGRYTMECLSKEEARKLFDDISSKFVISRSSPVHVVSGWLVESGVEDSCVTIHESEGGIFNVSPVNGGFLLVKNGKEIGTFKNIRKVSGEIIRQSSTKISD